MRSREILSGAYRGKRVLVTGHTGFKGSWLCMALQELGAHVSGFSIDVPTQPALYDSVPKSLLQHDLRGDVANPEEVRAAIDKVQPEYVFHLAAQPIVSASFENPVLTYRSNTLGTAVVLDEIRKSSAPILAVIITSDKCYENREWEWGYREEDDLGGADPYSSSKAAAEIIFSSFWRSYFTSSPHRVLSMRAGNVIGGGDWTKNRLLPDALRAIISGDLLMVRNPNSTRPWQHVLEPIIAYLVAGKRLGDPESNVNGQSFNVGPLEEPWTVSAVLTELTSHLPQLRTQFDETPGNFKEAGLLNLDCSKAKKLLGWAPLLSQQQSVAWTAHWFIELSQGRDPYEIGREQVRRYLELLPE